MTLQRSDMTASPDPGRQSAPEPGVLMHRLESSAEQIDALEPYRAVDRTGRGDGCWIAGHMVGGLDGTAAIEGRVGALSTQPDVLHFRRMRQLADLVMVGAETVRLEGYGVVRLDADAQEERRAQGRPQTPPLAVVSRSLDLDWSAKAFRDAPDHARTVVITTESADVEKLEAAREVADVIVAGETSVEPRRLRGELAQRGYHVVICEGGPTWLGELVSAGCLDELLLTISPVMGGDPLPVAVTPPGAGISHFTLGDVLREGDTLFLRYDLADHEVTS